jgi:ATP-dependent RNA helicase DeaD
MKESESTVTFDSLGLSGSTLESIKKCGFTSPTPIQEQVIPHILSGKDIAAQAQTGSGKTAAFGLPAMHMIETDREHTGLLVITPTRELAIQISEELARYGSHSKTRTLAIYGGSSSSHQIDAVRRGVNIVAATPGRLLDLLESKQLRDFKPSVVVLDEADEMLNMGFLEDVQAIFEYLPKEKQILLFSATMPKPIQKLAQKLLKDPVFVTVGTQGFSHQDIEHVFYRLDTRDRDEAFMRLLVTTLPTKAIIFCRTKKEVDNLTFTLVKHGLSAKSLHGDMEQNQRQRVAESFRAGTTKYLIATDVAARGLNISDVSHIFNYQIPFEAESYVHRAGRTGRAGNKGIAVTLGSNTELKKLQRLLNCQTNEILIKSVPSDREMYDLQIQNLITKVAKQQVHEEAAKVLKLLQAKIDPNQLLLSLVSNVIDREAIVKAKDQQVQTSSQSHQTKKAADDRPPRRFNDRKPRQKSNGFHSFQRKEYKKR